MQFYQINDIKFVALADLRNMMKGRYRASLPNYNRAQNVERYTCVELGIDCPQGKTAKSKFITRDDAQKLVKCYPHAFSFSDPFRNELKVIASSPKKRRRDSDKMISPQNGEMTNMSVVTPMTEPKLGCPQNCCNWGVEKVDGSYLIEPGTCGKVFNERKNYIFDYTYNKYDCTTFICECQLTNLGVKKPAPPAWVMHEIDASYVTPDIAFTKICTLTREYNNGFEADFSNRRVRVPRAAVHQPRPYDIDQTYNAGDHIEVLMMFKDVRIWTEAYVIKSCSDKSNYKVLLVQQLPGINLGLKTCAYSRMRKMK